MALVRIPREDARADEGQACPALVLRRADIQTAELRSSADCKEMQPGGSLCKVAGTVLKASGQMSVRGGDESVQFHP